MILKRLFSLSLIIFIGSTLTIQAQINEFQFEEYKLDNGLNVILYEDHTAPLVTVATMYHVGSKDEDSNRTGMAHFFEHLLFEGSKNIERGELDRYIENAGGRLNANTSNDRTFYYFELPSNQLELGLWIESERLLHAKVETEGIETQREVVKEEKRQRFDNAPYGQRINAVYSKFFTEHSYQWGVIGSIEHLNQASEDEFIAFYRKHYVPNNAVLVISGDFDPLVTKKMIADYFGTIPAGEKLNVYRDYAVSSKEDFLSQYFGKKANKEKILEAYDNMSEDEFIQKFFKKTSSKPREIIRPNIIEPAKTSEIRDTLYGNDALPMVIHVYPCPEIGAKDFYAVSMLNQILGRGRSSRLYEKVINEQQFALQVNFSEMPGEDPSVTICFSIANQGIEPKEVEEAIDMELEMVKNELVSEEELQKIKNQKESDFISRNSNNTGMAENLAWYYTFLDDTERINTELEKYLSVTREDIQRVAKEYFKKENRVIIYYLNGNSKK